MSTSTVELACLVKAMRDAQRAYFRAKRGTAEKYQSLERSKALERDVDMECAGILDDQRTFFITRKDI